MTTTVASSSHETINPANIVQPRAFVIAETVAGLLTVASACIPSFPVRAGVPSCPVAPSSTAFDGRGDAIGPVPTVEDKSPTLRLASTPIDAGVLSASEGVGVIFFSSIPYVLNDNTGTKNYADIAAEAMRYTVLLECAR